MGDEVSKQSKFFGRKIDDISITSNFVAANVHLDVAEAIDLERGRRRRDSSQYGFYARHQFTYGKWFRNVVVSAELETHNFINLLPARRQHDDRHRRPLRF